jgi:CSLREA domain-containing protein
MKYLHSNNVLGWKERASNLTLIPTNANLMLKTAMSLVLFLFISTTIVSAATFTVNTTTDNESNGCSFGQCTLREAINDANSSLGSDTISFQAGLNGTITLTGGHLPITSDITINGPGARILSVSGNNNTRVFVISGSGNIANISGLTITGGNAQPILLGGTLIGDGGGILNANGATLNLTEVNVTGNSATSLGGGVATRAILLVTTITYITRSSISNNTATAGGGGISNVGTTLISSAVTTATNSIITNNNALAEGGGISNAAGTMNLTNDTISNNQSLVAGGGVVNVVAALIGTINVRNNILAQNNALVGINLISSDGLGSFNSLGNNLVGNNLDVVASFPTSVLSGNNPLPNANSDLVGSLLSGSQIINPSLGPMTNNGGQTDVRALMPGSPAIDSGDNCVQTDTCANDPSPNTLPEPLLTDQRGAGTTRVSNTRTDAGSFESQSTPTAADVSVAGTVFDGGGNPVARAVIKLTNSAGEVRTTRTNQFGLFRFENVQSGEVYVAEVVHKKYTYTPQIVSVTDDITDLNFSAVESRLK